MTFFKDFSKSLAYTTASAVFLINYGPAIKEYLVTSQIIAISDQGIVTPWLADNIWYILALLILGFGSGTFLVVRGFWHEVEPSIPLLLIWACGVLSMLYSLAKPAPWWNVVFCLFVLYVLMWLLAKGLHAYFSDEY